MLLAAGVQHGASDIHLKVGDPPTYRVNGELSPLKYERLRPADTQQICGFLIQDPAVKAQLGELQEYDTSFSLPGVSRFRVNIYRQRGSLSLVLRIVPQKVPLVEDLGLPGIVREIAGYERGLVLVGGETGSGKSSTLAAMVNQINQTRRAHIVTIEDPIEFLHQNAKASISQREIGLDTRSYAVALRAALRQDPDVVLVGELRDAESIDIALRAAETGHLVLSTVDTTDAMKTVSRLVSVFPADEQRAVRGRLADALRATISQRLLARTDAPGRVVACEILVVTREVQEHLREGNAPLRELIEKGRATHHMQSFDQHLAELYRAGKIAMETAVAAAADPGALHRALA
jgi:twitching motility protein PilT